MMIDFPKRFLDFQVLAVFVLLILSSLCCSDASTPLAPEEEGIQDQLEFFPLRENYSVYYKFSYNYKFENFFHGRHTIDGTFHLGVIRVLKLEELNYYRIRSTFLIDKEYFYKAFANEIVDSLTRKDFFISTDYEVFFKDGSLWYFESANEVDSLGEGELSLMMEAPVAAGGEVDLKLFNYPELFDLGKYDGGVQGDSSFYRSVEEPKNWKKVKFARNKGVVEIDYFSVTGTSTHKNIETVKFELLD